MSRSFICIVLFLSSLWAGPVQAFQPPGNQMISIQATAGPHLLIKSPTVQKALGLTDSEVQWAVAESNKFESESREILQSELQAIMATGRVEIGAVQAKVAEVKADLAEMFYKDFGKELTPKQIEQLRSIELQMAGVQAFDRPDVKASLQITKDQATDIELTMEETKGSIASLRKELGIQSVVAGTTTVVSSTGGPNAPTKPVIAPVDQQKMDEFDAKQFQLQKKGLEEIHGLLNASQKLNYKKMFGEPIDTLAVRKEMKSAIAIKP